MTTRFPPFLVLYCSPLVVGSASVSLSSPVAKVVDYESTEETPRHAAAAEASPPPAPVVQPLITAGVEPPPQKEGEVPSWEAPPTSLQLLPPLESPFTPLGPVQDMEKALADKQAAAEAPNIPCDPTLSSSTYLGRKVEKQQQEELAARQQREAEAAAKAAKAAEDAAFLRAVPKAPRTSCRGGEPTPSPLPPAPEAPVKGQGEFVRSRCVYGEHSRVEVPKDWSRVGFGERWSVEHVPH